MARIGTKKKKKRQQYGNAAQYSLEPGVFEGFLQPPAGWHVRSSSLAQECSRSPLSSFIKSEIETADNAPARSSQSRGSCAHLPQTALSGEAD